MPDNEAGSLLIRIRATAEGLEAVAEEAKGRFQAIGQAAEQTRKPMSAAGQAGTDAGKKMAAGAKEAEMAWVLLAAAAVLAFREISSAIKQGIADANAYKDALRGLGSVAESAGISQSALDAATGKVVDQFFNAQAAATAFKNLLLRGYSLDQATNTILRLKDAAAFGRQASLSLSQAVTSATEGLKNENSILVDNAGVTKNVAKMWEDYAKARGMTVSAMTQAQKVEAEYLGIQQETAAMTGDIIKLQDSLSGKMAAAENQAYLLSKAYGEAMTPLQAAKTDLKTGVLGTLTAMVETFPGVASGATTATLAMVGMTAAVPVIQKIIALWKALQTAMAAAKLTMGTLGWIALGIGLIAGIYTAIANGAENARKAEEARVQANREAATAEQERAESMRTLLDTYVQLARKQSLSYTDAYNLVSIEATLAEQYGITKETLDKLVQSTDNYAESLNGVVNAATGQAVLEALEQQAADSWKAATDGVGNYLKLYHDHLATADRYETTGSGLPGDVEYHKAMAEKAKEQALAALSDYNEAVANELKAIKKETELQGSKFNTEISQILTSAIIPQIDPTAFSDADALNGFFVSLTDKIGAWASDPAYSDAFDTLGAFKEKIMTGFVPTDAEILDAQNAWYDLVGVDSGINFYLDTLVEQGVITAEQFSAAMAQLSSAADPLNVLGASVDKSKERIQRFIDEFSAGTGSVEEFQKKIEGMNAELDSLGQTLEGAKGIKTYTKRWSELYGAYRKARAEGKGVNDILDDMAYYLEDAGKAAVGSAEDIDATVESVNDHMGRLADSADDDITSATQRIFELQYAIEALEAMIGSGIYLTSDADVSAVLGAIALLRNQLNGLLADYSSAGIELTGTGKKSGGGGGGGSRSSAYEKAIDSLEHYKKLDQLTFEQELANLESIARKVRLNAEERIDLEERIYSVKKAIAERDAENLTDLTDAMMTALSERYSAMRDAELDTLEQSREAWEEWRDHNVSAIQDQIDALDALEQAEDRQQTQDEHLRRIAQLEQSLAYEQDGYNQLQLQKQVDKAKSEYADWLRDVEREDQRAALEAQIDAINERADTELSALDKQQEQIEAYYDNRMKQANLQAEAELELVNSTQQQIIDLLAEYAPDYDAAGRSLGERLMAGFTAAVGTFGDWFIGFEAQVTGAVDRIQAANVAAAAGKAQAYDANGNPVSGITITQQNTFNTPVETPAETARRIRQANEDLAERILGG